jgi:hypothetical protein
MSGFNMVANQSKSSDNAFNMVQSVSVAKKLTVGLKTSKGGVATNVDEWQSGIQDAASAMGVETLLSEEYNQQVPNEQVRAAMLKSMVERTMCNSGKGAELRRLIREKEKELVRLREGARMKKKDEKDEWGGKEMEEENKLNEERVKLIESYEKLRVLISRNQATLMDAREKRENEAVERGGKIRASFVNPETVCFSEEERDLVLSKDTVMIKSTDQHGAEVTQYYELESQEMRSARKLFWAVITPTVKELAKNVTAGVTKGDVAGWMSSILTFITGDEKEMAVEDLEKEFNSFAKEEDETFRMFIRRWTTMRERHEQMKVTRGEVLWMKCLKEALTKRTEDEIVCDIYVSTVQLSVTMKRTFSCMELLESMLPAVEMRESMRKGKSSSVMKITTNQQRTERTEDYGVCFADQDGMCKRGASCKFRHGVKLEGQAKKRMEEFRKKQKEKVVCHGCGKQGHFKSECKEAGGKEIQSEKKKESVKDILKKGVKDLSPEASVALVRTLLQEMEKEAKGKDD